MQLNLYKSTRKDSSRQSSDIFNNANNTKKFTQIRVERTVVNTRASTKVYLMDMTALVKQIRSETTARKEREIQLALQSYTATISHEFSTPISTCLQFLAKVLRRAKLDVQTRKALELVVA